MYVVGTGWLDRLQDQLEGNERQMYIDLTVEE